MKTKAGGPRVRGSGILFAIAAILTAGIAPPATGQKAPAQEALLTLYSQQRGGIRLWPAREPWIGNLWIDHQKIGPLSPGRFITLKLSEGDHVLAGMSFFGHESSVESVISLRAGDRYFMRLFIDSKAVAGVGPIHYVAEQVTCREAYREAVAAEPVKLKHIQKSSLELVVRDPYFPECEK